MFEVSPRERDLGVIARTDVVWTSFEVTNRSSVPLRILRVAGSCGCLGFRYDRRSLEPGESQELKVKLTASERAGKRLQVDVQVDAPGMPVQQVEVRCYARPDPVLRPAVVSFGMRPVGNHGEQTVILSYPLPVDLEPGPEVITSLEEGPVTGVAGVPGRLGVAGSTHVEVPVRFQLDASRPGPISGRFRLESALHEPVEISVRGRVHPGYYLKPDRLHLGRCQVGRTVRKTVRLMYTGDAPPSVTVAGDVPWVTASEQTPPPPAGAGFLLLEVEVTPPTAGSFQEVLRVSVGDDEPQVLTLQGMVRQ